MEVEILVSRAHGETRVAVLENEVIQEIHVERDHRRGVVGNIYAGRVSRVLPGMQAAFVEVGLDRAAFLYVDDVVLPGELQEDDSDEGPELDDDEGDPEALPTVSEAAQTPAEEVPERPPIEQLLREGQPVTVQVAKAPIGTKGARVTTYITLPGRYVVYMPTMRRIGVSRKITSDVERKRLKDLLTEIRQPGEGGFIARTVCQGLDETRIRQDVEFLRSLWAEVLAKTRNQTEAGLVMPDLDLVLRATRDFFNDDVGRMLLDDTQEAERVRRLLDSSAPHLADRVELYEGPSLFDERGVEAALRRALSREIHLKSGAAIVVDEAEALTAIDINTASFVGSRDLEATILKTNLESIDTIVEQIRLRNLGGIIIVDFIDMQRPESRELVYNQFLEALGRDRSRTHVQPMSGLGLVEMTRKRVRPSLGRLLTEPCPYCSGRGRVRSTRTICKEIFREIERQALLHPDAGLVVTAMPEVVTMLSGEEELHLLALERRLGRPVVIEARSDFHQETYQVAARPSTARP